MIKLKESDLRKIIKKELLLKEFQIYKLPTRSQDSPADAQELKRRIEQLFHKYEQLPLDEQLSPIDVCDDIDSILIHGDKS